ncbi:MAG: efflux RND transporter periplasmic adaptor subunit [Bacteroidales bacterium]
MRNKNQKTDNQKNIHDKNPIIKKTHKRKKKKIIWICIIILLSILIIPFPDGIEVKKVKACNPILSSICEVIPANGKVRPVTEVKISPDVSGEIVELNNQEGDQVKKGDLIIKIRQDVYLSILNRTTAALNSIKASQLRQQVNCRKAKSDYKRDSLLFEKGVIAQTDYDNALATYQMAHSQLKASSYDVESAQASLEESKENLRKTQIFAPMDGIISRMSIEKGERVVGTSQMAGTEMLRIADLNNMEVQVYVNENDISKIDYRDTAIIEVDAYPDQKFIGKITHIANSANNISSSFEQVTNFEVKVRFQKQKINFRPGMSASVSIYSQRKNSILTVPISSVTSRKNESGEVQACVFIINKDKVFKRIVKTGIQDMGKIEILSGLKINDLIVSSPYHLISKVLENNMRINYE